jgi:hypothetical protein
MRTKGRLAAVLATSAAAITACSQRQAPTNSAPVAVATKPSAATDDVATRVLRGRAFHAAVSGMPAVNTELMKQEMLTKTQGKVNQVLYWSKPADANNQTLTPNPDAIWPAEACVRRKLEAR